MNKETQMLIDRIRKEKAQKSLTSKELLISFVEHSEPAIYGHNEKNQWSWRIAREQKEKINYEEALKEIQNDIVVSQY